MLEKTVRIGECLTLATILISIVTLYTSFAKDRQLRMREHANEVRRAAGSTLAALDRTQDIADSLFIDLQPSFIDVSRIVDEQHDVLAARDLFWKNVNLARQRHEQRIVDERLQNGYTVLVGYDPNVRALFRTFLLKRKALDDEMFKSLLSQGEQDIFSFLGRQKNFTPALMGSKLRSTASARQDAYTKELGEVIGPLQSFLMEVLTRTDEEIVARRMTPPPPPQD